MIFDFRELPRAFRGNLCYNFPGAVIKEGKDLVSVQIPIASEDDKMQNEFNRINSDLRKFVENQKRQFNSKAKVDSCYSRLVQESGDYVRAASIQRQILKTLGTPVFDISEMVRQELRTAGLMVHIGEDPAILPVSEEEFWRRFSDRFGLWRLWSIWWLQQPRTGKRPRTISPGTDVPQILSRWLTHKVPLLSYGKNPLCLAELGTIGVVHEFMRDTGLEQVGRKLFARYPYYPSRVMLDQF